MVKGLREIKMSVFRSLALDEFLGDVLMMFGFVILICLFTKKDTEGRECAVTRWGVSASKTRRISLGRGGEDCFKYLSDNCGIPKNTMPFVLALERKFPQRNSNELAVALQSMDLSCCLAFSVT